MKTKLLIFSIALCLSAAPAMASYDSGKSVIDRVNGYYAGSGGEFTLSTATLSTSGYSSLTKDIVITDYSVPGTYVDMTTSFQTFCVETNEGISPTHYIEQTWVNWDGTDSYAVAGGSGGPQPDDLDPRTAYLYTQFATGNLSNYDYDELSTPPGDDRDTDAQQLQKAIWYIEEEIGLTWDGSKWVQTIDVITELGAGSKALAWYNEAVALSTAADLAGVSILNLYDHSSLEYRQDMLHFVPVPAAVLLGMLGLGVAGIKLRKYA